MPGHPPFVVKVGEWDVVMPFLRFKDVNGEPHQFGTEGAGQMIHGRPILAGPIEGESNDHDEDLEILVSEPTHNFAVAQALDYLDDPGVLSEVARFRNYAAQLPVVLDRSRMFHDLVTAFGAFQECFNDENRAFLAKMEQCRQRLVGSKVRARVDRAMMQLHQRGELGGRYYWPGLPGVPEHLGRLYLLARLREPSVSEASWDPPLMTRTEQRRSGAARALARREARYTCKLCGEKGHFNKYCQNPHTKCQRVCQVPSSHTKYFPAFCGFIHVDAKKKRVKVRRKRLETRLAEQPI